MNHIVFDQLYKNHMLTLSALKSFITTIYH